MDQLESALKLSKGCLSLAGFWPSEIDRKPNWCLVKSYLIAANVLVLMVYQCYSVSMVLDDATAFVESASNLVGSVLTIFKTAPFIIHRREFIHVLEMTRSQLTEREETADIEETSAFWNAWRDTAVKYLSRIYYVSIAIFLIAPVILREFPFKSTLPAVVYENPWYEIIYVVQTVAILGQLCAIIIGDTLLLLLVCHVCCELHITAMLLRKLGRCQRESYLTSAIRRHNAALGYGKAICPILSVGLFFQAVLSSCFLCLVGFIMLRIDNPISRAKIFISILMSTMQLLLNCCVGETISAVSLDVLRAAEDSDWVSCSVSDQKAVALVIARAQRPMRFTVGTFGTLNLKLFVDYMNTAVSYVVILNTITR